MSSFHCRHCDCGKIFFFFFIFTWLWIGSEELVYGLVFTFLRSLFWFITVYRSRPQRTICTVYILHIPYIYLPVTCHANKIEKGPSHHEYHLIRHPCLSPLISVCCIPTAFLTEKEKRGNFSSRVLLTRHCKNFLNNCLDWAHARLSGVLFTWASVSKVNILLCAE